jgi:hypothetical protein
MPPITHEAGLLESMPRGITRGFGVFLTALSQVSLILPHLGSCGQEIERPTIIDMTGRSVPFPSRTDRDYVCLVGTPPLHI